MQPELKTELRLVCFQFVSDVVLGQRGVKFAQTAGPDGEPHVGAVILFIVVPDKQIFAEGVVVDACVGPVSLLGCVLVRDAKPCLPGRVEGIGENDLRSSSLSQRASAISCMRHRPPPSMGKLLHEPFLVGLKASSFWVRRRLSRRERRGSRRCVVARSVFGSVNRKRFKSAAYSFNVPCP